MSEIIIYSKDNCSQCEMSKMFLDMKSVEYTVKKLNTDFSLEELKELVPTAKTFPIVFIDNEYKGSYNELKQLYK